MNLELITIRELLRDPKYREFFIKIPELPPHYTPEVKPWKLLVLKEGETKWRAKRYGTYREAFDGFKRMLPLITNAAINSPALTFMPPVRTVRVKGKFVVVRGKQKPVIKSLVWKPQITSDMEPHIWCSHCRRPSIFKNVVVKPREVGGFAIPTVAPVMRCIICGASERIVDLRNPTNAQKWDPNRPKIY
jgi:hypothetical protein